ncbi:hypothetical protein GE09DRAFT_1290123, partial [Coniochaeta sp. 2T2.1]
MSILEKVIDSDGDVCLRVYAKNSCRHSPRHYEHDTGDGEVRPEVFPEEAEDTIFNLLVLAKVLSVASPVFKAMFYGRFREGREPAKSRAASAHLYAGTAGGQRRCDDQSVLLVHAKLDEVSMHPQGCCMQDIAAVAENLWLKDYQIPSIRYPDLCEDHDIGELWGALACAYTVDLPTEYSAVAWAIVRCGEPRYPSVEGVETTQEDISYDEYYGHMFGLPDEVIARISTERNRCRQLMYEAMWAPLSWQWQTMSSACMCAAKAVGVYTSGLNDRRLFATRVDVAGNMDVNAVLSHVNALPVVKASKYQCSSGRNGADDCLCRSDPQGSLNEPLAQNSNMGPESTLRNEIILDPDGDMYLQPHGGTGCCSTGVDEETPEDINNMDPINLEGLSIRVSSNVLALASPVFRAMLYGDFKEAADLVTCRAASQYYTNPLRRPPYEVETLDERRGGRLPEEVLVGIQKERRQIRQLVYSEMMKPIYETVHIQGCHCTSTTIGAYTHALVETKILRRHIDPNRMDIDNFPAPN